MTKFDSQLASFATIRQLEYLEAIDKYGTQSKAAKHLGVTKRSLERSLQWLRKKAALQGWSPAHDMNKVVPDGYLVKGVSTYYNSEGQKAGQWVKSSLDNERVTEIRQAAIEAMCGDLPRLLASPAPAKTIDQLCNLYTFTDYHLGMLAWHKEGGADWDLKIAEAVLWNSFHRMVEAAPAAATAVLNIQGDFLHSDGLLPVTPAHKHVLDQDGRFSKIVTIAIRVLRRLIDHALAKHDKVHLLIVEGNHDEASSIWLRHMFSALYENEPRLTVNDSELPYYVYQHGEVMLAFHHGHKMKNEQMPMLFAAQFPVMWGQTKARYCHTGHRHHLDEKEYSGMTVTQHPTLSARDAYAARGGWIAERAAMAITYHKKQGQYGRTFVSPELTEDAL